MDDSFGDGSYDGLSGAEDFDDYANYSGESFSDHLPCSDTYVIPGQSDIGYFATFSVEALKAFNLDSEEGWIFAIIAVEGFQEWCCVNYCDASRSNRCSVLLQCMSVMLTATRATGIFRNASRTYMFLWACEVWDEFYYYFVDLANWTSSFTGKVSALPVTAKDIKKATNSTNKIAASFDCSKDLMRTVASNSAIRNWFLDLDTSWISFLPIAENSLSNQIDWTGSFANLSIILLPYNIKTPNISEGSILNTPLLANVERVEYVNERKKVSSEVSEKPGKIGKNARKKLLKDRGVGMGGCGGR